MASSFIRMQAIGNIGKELKFNTLSSGTSVLNFSIASTERWTDKQTNQKKEKTTWLDCVAFGPLAEMMNQYLKAGSRVYLSGDYAVNTFVNADQQTVKTSRMEVKDFTALDKVERADQSSSYVPQQDFNHQPQQGFNQPQQGFNNQPQQGFNRPQQGFNNQPQQGFNQPQNRPYTNRRG